MSKLNISKNGMAITGELVFASVTEILEQGNDCIQQFLSTKQTDNIAIDCSQIERIDSAGIATLIDWQRQCSKANVTARFDHFPKQSQSLIKAYCLETLLSA